MTTSTFNVRMDDELRTQATQVFESYGLSPTQAIKIFFNQVVRTNKIPLNFDYNEQETLEPSDSTLKALWEIQNHQTTRYTSPEQAMQAMLELAK